MTTPSKPRQKAQPQAAAARTPPSKPQTPATKPAKTRRTRPSAQAANTPLGLWRARVSDALALGIGQLTDPKLSAARQVQKGRQATKAARALLRLAPPELKPQARGLIMGLSTVRRLLAETRDTDALIETLRAVAAETKLAKPALAMLLKPLRARRLPLGRLQVDEAAEAVAMLKKIASTVAKLRLPQSAGALTKAARKEYRVLRRETRPGLNRLPIEALHDLRKTAINHRHQTAFLSLLAAGKNKARLDRQEAQARLLHETIGRHRDLELLAEHLRPSREPVLHAERQSLLEAIGRQQKIALKQAMAVAEKLTRAKPRRLFRKLTPAAQPARAGRKG